MNLDQALRFGIPYLGSLLMAGVIYYAAKTNKPRDTHEVRTEET